MDKKPYSPPKVTKVKLEIKQSVLGSCNTTTNNSPGIGDPFGPEGCQTSFCFSFQ